MNKITIYDTTLRDGNQAMSVNLSLEDKLAIARMLDDFGVDYIEGGWPNATNPIDIAFYERAMKMAWKNARICAFGSTRKANVSASQDEGLKYLLKSNAPVITIFGKSWDLHVTDIIRTSLKENLLMIRESVSFLKKKSKEVVYDAEHFFDGFRENPEYAMKTLEAAKEGGADCIVLCDTNGGMCLPWEMEHLFESIKKELNVPLGIHAHNDTGTAVANSLAAVKGGAVMVQGTINGYGERCGNANLTVLIPDLQLKMNRKVVSKDQLKQLRTLSLSVGEIANLSEDVRQPFTGEAAFSHKGGAHIDGVLKVSRSFEHIDPSEVGNRRDFIVSDQAGSALVLEKIRHIKKDATKKDPEVRKVLAELKKLESEGYHFEVADGSFRLMVRRVLNGIEEKFKVLSYRVIEENQSEGRAYCEATVKVNVGGNEEHTCAEGNGPVDAMARAVRRSLRPYFPELDLVKLADYKVRVLDEDMGSAAKVRVLTRFHDESDNVSNDWWTLGVSTNIIEASWKALMDGFNYKLLILGK